MQYIFLFLMINEKSENVLRKWKILISYESYLIFLVHLQILKFHSWLSVFPLYVWKNAYNKKKF